MGQVKRVLKTTILRGLIFHRPTVNLLGEIF